MSKRSSPREAEKAKIKSRVAEIKEDRVRARKGLPTKKRKMLSLHGGFPDKQ